MTVLIYVDTSKQVGDMRVCARANVVAASQQNALVTRAESGRAKLTGFSW